MGGHLKTLHLCFLPLTHNSMALSYICNDNHPYGYHIRLGENQNKRDRLILKSGAGVLVYGQIGQVKLFAE